jgi:hypothetical protein
LTIRNGSKSVKGELWMNSRKRGSKAQKWAFFEPSAGGVVVEPGSMLEELEKQKSSTKELSRVSTETSTKKTTANDSVQKIKAENTESHANVGSIKKAERNDRMTPANAEMSSARQNEVEKTALEKIKYRTRVFASRTRLRFDAMKIRGAMAKRQREIGPAVFDSLMSGEHEAAEVRISYL